jgi:hypothetical protein
VQIKVELLFGSPIECMEVLAALMNTPNAIRGLQHDLAQAQAGAPNEQSPNEQEPESPGIVDASGQPVTAAEASQRPSVLAPTKENVEAVAEQLAEQKGFEAAREVLAGMGLRRVQQLQPSQYAEFIQRCQAALAVS